MRRQSVSVCVQAVQFKALEMTAQPRAVCVHTYVFVCACACACACVCGLSSPVQHCSLCGSVCVCVCVFSHVSAISLGSHDYLGVPACVCVRVQGSVSLQIVFHSR